MVTIAIFLFCNNTFLHVLKLFLYLFGGASHYLRITFNINIFRVCLFFCWEKNFFECTKSTAAALEDKHPFARIKQRQSNNFSCFPSFWITNGKHNKRKRQHKKQWCASCVWVYVKKSDISWRVKDEKSLCFFLVFEIYKFIRDARHV